MMLNKMVHYYDEGFITEKEFFALITEEFDESWLLDVLSSRTDITKLIKNFQKERSLNRVLRRSY